MKTQSYKNHIRFYPPHHFVYYPIVMGFIIVSIYFAVTTSDTLIWSFVAAIFGLLFSLAFMIRQHYALTLQNRIVRLEMRYRYFTLTNKKYEIIESEISDEQLFALRFAPDEELIALIDKTLTQNLSGSEIKKAIVNWKGDYFRV
jgi:hypothetical protein